MSNHVPFRLAERFGNEPPGLPAQPRRGLEAWLQEPMPRAWILVGGAGAGKTCAARLMAERLGGPLIWLDRPTPKSLGTLLGMPEDSSDEAVGSALCTALGDRYPGGATFVLDAAEQLSGPCLAAIVRAPSPLAVIVTRRPDVPRGLARLVAEGSVRLLYPSDLYLRPEERAEWVGGDPTPAAELGGWPLGTQVLATHGPKPGRMALLMELVQTELLDPLPVELRTQAIRYAPLPTLTPEAFAKLGATGDSRALVDAWQRWGLVSTSDGALTWIPMVRIVLLSAWLSITSLEDQDRTIQVLLGTMTAGERARAIRWLLDHGHQRHALGILRDLQAEATRRPGLKDRLAECLALFPEQARTTLPELLLVAGDLLRARGAHADAAARYAEAERIWQQQGDEAHAFEALVSRLNLAAVRQETAETARLEAEARAREAFASPFQRHRFYNLRAGWHADQGREEEAVADLRRILAHPHFDDPDYLTLHMVASLNLGWIYEEHGDFLEAPRLFERVIAIAESFPDRPSAARAARLFLALICCWQGDVAGAREHLSRLGQAPLEDRLREAASYRLEGDCHLWMGELAAASDCFQKALSLFGSLGHSEQVDAGATLGKLAVIARWRGEFASALELHHKALPKVKDIPRVKADVLLEWGLTHLAAGAAGEARRVLEEALACLKGIRTPFLEARALLALAAAADRSGDDRAAARHLAAALEIVARGGYYHVLVLQREIRPDLWRLLNRHGHQAQLAKVEASFPQEAAEIRAQLAADGPALPPAPPAALVIRTFGPMIVKVAGTPAEWPRKKAKVLLANLLLSPHGLSRAELCETLFPELAEKVAQGRLDQLVFSLRKVLGGGLTFKEGRYELARQGLWVDHRAFDEAYARGHRARQQGADAEAIACFETAVELYRGPLFTELADGFEAERHHYLTRALELLGLLAEAHLKASHAERARACLDRLLELDPCNEAAHRQLMALYLQFERPDLARRQYQLCERLLRQELDVEPSDETRALAGRLQPLAEGA